jgi:asparagine synthetase B (glutamine-hydrolysing)
VLAGFQGNFDAGLLARMNEAIAHRGPDDAGMWYLPESGVGLAHR